ncbi:hypothetical protein NLI96_g655 [Meripilus lineatus]|uniref:Uncharacterized protein n=1 Tax=Meripilus lineatus TaxID=2056292 RepID=A0AAD5VBS7_9APHY|nr:hypothetical protein NLI96_g655 [Physisporinus lineatus]
MCPSLHDPLELSHLHPLYSHLHSSQSRPNTPLPFSTDMIASGHSEDLDHTYDHIFTLEQEFCSSFLCCGLHLSGLHDLLDHFEESHVVVIARDGRPIYPSPVPTTNSITPSASSSNRKRPTFDHPEAFSSIVISYPQPYPSLNLDSTQPEAPVTTDPLPSPQPRASRNQSIYTDILPSYGAQEHDPSTARRPRSNSTTPRNHDHYNMSNSTVVPSQPSSESSNPSTSANSDSIPVDGTHSAHPSTHATSSGSSESTRNHSPMDRKRSSAVVKLKYSPPKLRAISSRKGKMHHPQSLVFFLGLCRLITTDITHPLKLNGHHRAIPNPQKSPTKKTSFRKLESESERRARCVMVKHGNNEEGVDRVIQACEK